MNRRIFVVGALVALVLILVIGTLNIFGQPKHINLYSSSSGGANIQFPYLAGPHTLDFFTGSGFASYDTTSQVSQSISPQFNLPAVGTVRWSKTGVLFEVSDYTGTDDLSLILASDNLPTTQNYWWLYNFASQKLSLVSTANQQNSAVSAVWNSSGNNYCYLTADGSLYTSSAPDQPIYSNKSASGVEWFNGSSVIVNEGDSLKQIDLINQGVKTLFSVNSQALYVSPDGQTIAYVLNTHPKSNDVVPGDLYKVNPANDKASKVLSNFNGVLAGDDGNLYAGYSDTSGNHHLNLYPKTGKTIVYSPGSALKQAGNISDILPENSGSIYVDLASNSLVRLTTNPDSSIESINATSLFSNLPFQGPAASYEIDVTFPFADDVVSPTIVIKAPTPQARQAALQWIRDKGYDPSDYKIDFQNQTIVNNHYTNGVPQ